MPVFHSWILAAPATVSPFSWASTALPPILGSPVTCDVDVYSQADLLRVVDRSYPEEYLSGLKNKANGGYEIFQANAKIGERVSIAIGRWFCCSFLATAGDGHKATGTVEFYRGVIATEFTTAAYWIKRGSVVRTVSNKEFLTVEDVFVDSGEYGPFEVGVEAVTEGYAYNVAGAVVSAGGEVLEGEISRIKKAVLFLDTTGSPSTIDLNLRVRNTAPTTGGTDKCLDALGQDVGIFRRLGESEDAYRLRIITTPDAVSPDAIRRGANALLAPYNSAICLREVGTNLLPGIFWDAPASSDPRENFAWDMDGSIRPEDRFKLWLDTIEFRGFFLVGVPAIVESEYTGLFYDGVINEPHELDNAYDTTSFTAKNAGYDGFSLLSQAVYAPIWETINQKKAGGVGFDLYIENVGCF